MSISVFISLRRKPAYGVKGSQVFQLGNKKKAWSRGSVYRTSRLAKAFTINKRKRPTPQSGREQFTLFSLYLKFGDFEVETRANTQ